MYLSVKIKKKPSLYKDHLKQQTMVMLFQKTSTRTRVSFEAGFFQLGGQSIYLDWDKSNFQLSKIYYEAISLSQNANILMARLRKHDDLQELKKGSSVPVINGCCNRYHPCQSLADVLTIYEDCGHVRGVKIAYIGVFNNVSNSLLEVAHLFGMELTLVCPIVPEGIMDIDVKNSLSQKGLLKESLDVREVVKNVDYVYTDTWLDLEFFDRAEYRHLQEERTRKMLPYQINTSLMRETATKILHDMPIHPNYEISPDMVESPNSLIFSQSANRIHAQKAIVLYLLGAG